jgi:hypothetical protein
MPMGTKSKRMLILLMKVETVVSVEVSGEPLVPNLADEDEGGVEDVTEVDGKPLGNFLLFS